MVNKACCCCFNILQFFKLELKNKNCQFWTCFSISLKIIENLIVKLYTLKKLYTDQISTARLTLSLRFSFVKGFENV